MAFIAFTDWSCLVLSCPVLCSDSAGGLGGYEILKLHDADPLLGVEVKFVDKAACWRFLESYGSGAVQQSLSQHACRLLTGPQEGVVKTQLKAGMHTLDHNLDNLELFLEHIHLSQVVHRQQTCHRNHPISFHPGLRLPQDLPLCLCSCSEVCI